MPMDSAESIFLFKFWLRMGEAYRQLWTDTQGAVPTDLWARYLLKIGEKRASEALVAILKSGKTYPPTLPEFIEASKAKPIYFVRLPRPPVNKELAKNTIEEIKRVLGKRYFSPTTVTENLEA